MARDKVLVFVEAHCGLHMESYAQTNPASPLTENMVK